MLFMLFLSPKIGLIVFGLVIDYNNFDFLKSFLLNSGILC